MNERKEEEEKCAPYRLTVFGASQCLALPARAGPQGATACRTPLSSTQLKTDPKTFMLEVTGRFNFDLFPFPPSLSLLYPVCPCAGRKKTLPVAPGLTCAARLENHSASFPDRTQPEFVLVSARSSSCPVLFLLLFLLLLQALLHAHSLKAGAQNSLKSFALRESPDCVRGEVLHTL